MELTGRLLFWALLSCNVLFILIVFRRRGPAGTGSGKGGATVGFGIVLQTLSYPFAWVLRRPRISPFGGDGIWPDILIACTCLIIAIGSLALAAAAKRRLGKHWALAARVMDGHLLVTGGPYSRVRHPLYLAMGMLLVSVVFGLSSMTGAESAALFFGLGTTFRIQKEESLLAGTFGREFEEYRRRVPALFPRLRSRPAKLD